MPETPVLQAEKLSVAYGDATALWDVSLSVGKGEIVSVLGPNGAGKTTLVNAIARLLPIRGGQLRLDGADVTRIGAQEMCGHGVGLIPEGRRLFTTMTVEENLELGCYRPAARAHRAQGLDQIYAMFPILRERRWQIAGTLSGGQQQMVAIGRALMARPKLLLIDEPSLGLAPVVITQVFETIKAIHASGVSILLIEQNAAKALAVSQRAYVLDCGAIVAQGSPEELL